MTRLFPAALAVLALTGCPSLPCDDCATTLPLQKEKKLAEGGWALHLKKAQAEGECHGMEEEISRTTLDMWLNRKDNGRLVMDVEGLSLRGEQDGSSIYAELTPPSGGGPVPVEDDDPEPGHDDDTDAPPPPPCHGEDTDSDVDTGGPPGGDDDHGGEDREEPCPGEEGPPPPPPSEEIFVILEGESEGARAFSGSLSVIIAGPGRDCEMYIPLEAEFVGGERHDTDVPVVEPMPAEPGYSEGSEEG